MKRKIQVEAMLVGISILFLSVLIWTYLTISSLQRENKRIYLALKCVYINIDRVVKEDKLEELELALLIDLTKDIGYFSKDKTSGCFDKFGLRGY